MVKIKKDLMGQKFGMLTVLRQVDDYVSPGGQHKARWECQCDCDNHTIINVVGSSLINHTTTNCGCQNKYKYMDLTGQKFDKLTVIKKVEKPETRKNEGVYWLCECSCQEHNKIIVSTSDLKSGHVKSCGCLRKEAASKNITNINIKMAGSGKPSKITKFEENDDCLVGIASNTKNQFYIDKEDLDKVKKYTWYENEDGYLMSRIDGELIRLHRLIMDCPDDLEIDHINHNTLDNRKRNLRIVTRQQNSMNKNSKGVCFDKSKNKYMAYIGNGVGRHLGYFDTYEDARTARLNAEDKLYGEYSYTNSMKVSG